MPQKAKVMERLEDELDIAISKAKRAGLSYPRILYCILHRLEIMVYQCSAEGWMDKDTK